MNNLSNGRPLDDIDLLGDETHGGAAEGRIEFALFTEGEYVESIFIDRDRAAEIYRDLGAILGTSQKSTTNSTLNEIFSNRETATILAALRYWRREVPPGAGHERDIETDFDRLQAPSVDEIDALCQRFNQPHKAGV